MTKTRRELLGAAGAASAALAGCSRLQSDEEVPKREQMQREINEIGDKIAEEQLENVDKTLEGKGSDWNHVTISSVGSRTADRLGDDGYRTDVWFDYETDMDWDVLNSEGRLTEEAWSSYGEGLTALTEAGISAALEAFPEDLLDNGPDFPEVNNLVFNFTGQGNYAARASFNAEDYMDRTGEIKLDSDSVRESYRVRRLD